MFWSRYVPCPECGASVDATAMSRHACSPERRAAQQMSAAAGELEQLEPSLQRWLDSATGRFEVWVAARQVRAAR